MMHLQGRKMNLKTLSDTPPWEWPKDTAEVLLNVLRNNRAGQSDRLLAAELAGDYTVINDALADALLSILGSEDESERVRAQAVISLGPALEQAYIEDFEDPDDVPITEPMFRRIQEILPRLYRDARVPKDVRRRILEASAHAPEDWHRDAVRAAYASGDEDWKLTAVFCMRFIRGFDHQILESLDSENPDIHYEAVGAAGNWEVKAAWKHIAGLAVSEETDKLLRLAAIEAMAAISPLEAADILLRLMESDDEDIVDAAEEAMGMAEALSDEEDE
jgi:HEAT repeat protein